MASSQRKRLPALECCTRMISVGDSPRFQAVLDRQRADGLERVTATIARLHAIALSRQGRELEESEPTFRREDIERAYDR